VVATDLRGDGDSGKPRGLPDHSNYSFRRMAQDQVEVHGSSSASRGSWWPATTGAPAPAIRMASRPSGPRAATLLHRHLPHAHVWPHTTREWALNAYHWAFMAQPYDFPEQLLAGNEEYYIRLKLGSQGLGKGGIAEEALREYVRCCTPARHPRGRARTIGRGHHRLRDGHEGPRRRVVRSPVRCW
jgi:haloacetate dehalogenase